MSPASPAPPLPSFATAYHLPADGRSELRRAHDGRRRGRARLHLLDLGVQLLDLLGEVPDLLAGRHAEPGEGRGQRVVDPVADRRPGALRLLARLAGLVLALDLDVLAALDQAVEDLRALLLGRREGAQAGEPDAVRRVHELVLQLLGGVLGVGVHGVTWPFSSGWSADRPVGVRRGAPCRRRRSWRRSSRRGRRRAPRGARCRASPARRGGRRPRRRARAPAPPGGGRRGRGGRWRGPRGGRRRGAGARRPGGRARPGRRPSARWGRPGPPARPPGRGRRARACGRPRRGRGGARPRGWQAWTPSRAGTSRGWWCWCSWLLLRVLLVRRPGGDV